MYFGLDIHCIHVIQGENFTPICLVCLSIHQLTYRYVDIKFTIVCLVYIIHYTLIRVKKKSSLQFVWCIESHNNLGKKKLLQFVWCMFIYTIQTEISFYHDWCMFIYTNHGKKIHFSLSGVYEHTPIMVKKSLQFVWCIWIYTCCVKLIEYKIHYSLSGIHFHLSDIIRPIRGIKLSGVYILYPQYIDEVMKWR